MPYFQINELYLQLNNKPFRLPGLLPTACDTIMLAHVANSCSNSNRLHT